MLSHKSFWEDSTSKTDLLQQLVESAKPIAEITCYSGNRGIYGFFLLRGSLCIGQDKFVAGNSTLLYLGKTESSQKKHCAGEHLATGKTGHSTPRRSLGALLLEELNLKPQPRSNTETSKRRFTNFKFDAAGEERLTTWMKRHLGLGFCELPHLTALRAKEKELIKTRKPPLNIVHNSGNAGLSLARGRCARLAKSR